MRVEKDFEEFIELLNKHKVRYVIVGAYALAFHVRPRMTGDIDFLVAGTIGNVEKLMRVLDEFGFGNVGLTRADFLDPNRVVQLGFEPNRIDILSEIAGVDFADAYRKKVQGSFGKQKAWFLSSSDLLKSKRAAGRPKDKADVQLLMSSLRKRRRRNDVG